MFENSPTVFSTSPPFTFPFGWMLPAVIDNEFFDILRQYIFETYVFVLSNFFLTLFFGFKKKDPLMFSVLADFCFFHFDTFLTIKENNAFQFIVP